VFNAVLNYITVRSKYNNNSFYHHHHLFVHESTTVSKINKISQGPRKKQASIFICQMTGYQKSHWLIETIEDI